MKLPRLIPIESWILNQFVMCNIKHEDFERYYENAKKKNQEFIQQYHNLRSIDIYFATSMRKLEEVERAEILCNEFEDKGFLVYNPANNCESSRYRKCDLEEHMLSIAKAIVIDAGERDTGGKFIEAGRMKFGLNKRVFMLAQDTEKAKQYSVYHDWHPSGVSLGVHVAETVDKLAKCIDAEFKGQTKTSTGLVDGRYNHICTNCSSVIERSKSL